jgi:hypothetical protein
MLEKLKDPTFRTLCAFVSRSWIINEFDYDYVKMIEHFNNDIKQLENPSSPWYDGKHGGDCINAPGACLRCHVEAAVNEALELIEENKL